MAILIFIPMFMLLFICLWLYIMWKCENYTLVVFCSHSAVYGKIYFSFYYFLWKMRKSWGFFMGFFFNFVMFIKREREKEKERKRISPTYHSWYPVSQPSFYSGTSFIYWHFQASFDKIYARNHPLLNRCKSEFLKQFVSHSSHFQGLPQPATISDSITFTWLSQFPRWKDDHWP